MSQKSLWNSEYFTHQVYDNKKFTTTFKPLAELLATIPCEICQHTISNDTACNPAKCEKMEAWIIEGCKQ